MKNVLVISFFLLISSIAYSQVKGKALRLEGVWDYKGNSGYEDWKLTDGELFGTAYRIGKLGDTSIVEEMTIRKVNKQLNFTSTIFNYSQDSLIAEMHVFIGGKRKMNFVNVDRDIPHSIRYSFGFLNRKKLKIDIYFNEGDKAKTIVLLKRKD